MTKKEEHAGWGFAASYLGHMVDTARLIGNQQLLKTLEEAEWSALQQGFAVPSEAPKKRGPGYRVRAERMRALRQRRGMRQEDLAKAVGVTVGTISRIETRYHVPQLGTVSRLEDALGGDLLELDWDDEEENQA